VTGPKAPQLEIRFAELDGAELLAGLVTMEDITLRTRDRGRFAVAEARGAETTADLLALAGASDAALLIDEDLVIGAARAAANRLANADHANLVRTARSAHGQLRAIQALEQAGALASLPADLQEVAALRFRYPSHSLRELALKCEPVATKSAVQRRLARLVELAGDRLDT
jgi:DNA-binding protein WhiA